MPTATIQVTSPNGGENWLPGSTHDISWSCNNITNVKIEYTIDNGNNWIVISSIYPALLGKYSWTVPNTPSSQCKIRISDTSNPSTITDQSENGYSIGSTPSSSISETEPNNSFGNANYVGNGYTVSGTIGYSGDTEDWFKLILPADGKLVLTETTGIDLWSGINLFDADGTHLFAWSEATKNGIDDLTYDNLAAGTYYIKIGNWSNGQGAYALKITDYPAELTNDDEINDTYQQANDIVVNSTHSGHIGYYSNQYTDVSDWYKVAVPSDGKLEIIQDCRNNLWSGMYLFDGDGSHQITWKEARKNGIDTLIYPNLMAGNYYLRISNRGNGYGEYQLKVNHYPAEFTNDLESNNSSATAVNLTLNNNTTGHIGFYSNQTTDTEDWYKINISTGQKLRLVETTSSELWSGITVYKSDLSSVYGSEALKGKPDTLIIDYLPTGDYFVKIYNWGNGYGSYNFKIESLKQPEQQYPIAYYPFNGNVNDESGNGINGINFGATLTTDRFGNPNSAYSFNGISNYIDIPGTNALHLTSGLALCAWINFTESSSLHEIVGKHISGYGNGYYLMIRPATTPEFYISSEPGLESSDVLNDGQWHFLVGNYDGVTQNLYIDGRLKSSQAKTYSTTNDSTIMIGKQHEGVAANWFNGKIDDVCIYNRPLTELEITALYGAYNKVNDLVNEQFMVYPNPTKGIINIISEVNEIPDKLTVYDIAGRICYFSTEKPLKRNIDLSGLQKGMYILKFNFKDQLIISKLAKE
jgi:hypothetical protein